MSNKNDARILDLRKKIEEKKEALTLKNPRFTPATNCKIFIDGLSKNINVMDKYSLIPLITQLTVLHNTAKDLGIDKDYYISGFHISDWLNDLNSFLKKATYNEELEQLNELEKKLKKLLSSEKQVELELDNIENLLK